MPDNMSTTAVTDGVTSAQEIPSSNSSADERTPEPSRTPDQDKSGFPDVSSSSVGEVVLTPLKSPKEKPDTSPSKKPTNTPKKAPGKLTNTKKAPKGKSQSEVTRVKSLDGKPATPKKMIPQATLTRQSTVSSMSSTTSAPGTPKKAVRLDISLDGNDKLGTPKKKLNMFRSKSPKKTTSKLSGLKKPKPLRSSTPKRNSNMPVKRANTVVKQEEGKVNGAETTANENGLQMTDSPQRDKSTSRVPKSPRKVFVSSTRPPKIAPRSQSPSKVRKGKPSAWR